jgi:hypothetical protein
MTTPRYILLGLVIAQLADAITFAIGVARVGIHYETNGVAQLLFHSGGIDAVLGLKLLVILVTLALLALTAHRFPRLLVLGGAVATSLGLIGFLANSATILLS